MNWDHFAWSNRTVEEVARVLYDRFRNQGPRLGLGFDPAMDDSHKPWAELTEARRNDFMADAQDALDAMLKGFGYAPCPDCEGVGSYYADCTTFDRDCGCNGPRIPCTTCNGEGEISR